MGIYLSPSKRLWLVIGFLCTLASASVGAAQYRITDLGDLLPSSINQHGQIAGMLLHSQRAGIYDNGHILVLDPSSEPNTASVAVALNDQGVAVGQRITPGPNLASVPFKYADGIFTKVQLPNMTYGYFTDINNNGIAIGDYVPKDQSVRSFIFDQKIIGELNSDDGSLLSAMGINDAGQIAGIHYPPPADTNRDIHGFVYFNGKVFNLGDFGGGYSDAIAINNNGVVTGSSTYPGAPGDQMRHAFIYSDGQMRDLGVLGGLLSFPHGMNDLGDVVGESSYALNSLMHGFIAGRNDIMDLNDLIDRASGWELTLATDINNLGQIVGQGWLKGFDDNPRGFLLTPVPEPGLLPIGTTLLVIGSRRYRRMARLFPQ
jgi:probable HAF family extracellular repeat protein